jgi:hypothetical protein
MQCRLEWYDNDYNSEKIQNAINRRRVSLTIYL